MRAVQLATVMCVALAVGWLLLRPTTGGEDALLVNRLWVERLPRDDKDMVLRLILVEEEGEQGGAVLVSSAWRIFVELFFFTLQGDQMRVELPQEGKHFNAKVRTWRCKGQAPEPFELCLEVRVARKKQLFYSREDWVIRPGERVPGTVALAPTAEALRGPSCVDCVEGGEELLLRSASTEP
ncbi:MAG: hypothetical protein AB2A00_22575 [Myxococcota bacterium]